MPLATIKSDFDGLYDISQCNVLSCNQAASLIAQIYGGQLYEVFSDDVLLDCDNRCCFGSGTRNRLSFGISAMHPQYLQQTIAAHNFRYSYGVIPSAAQVD